MIEYYTNSSKIVNLYDLGGSDKALKVTVCIANNF
jgi:hypothetical protein